MRSENQCTRRIPRVEGSGAGSKASLFVLAERRLDPAAWKAIEDEWSARGAPLFGPQVEAAFRTLRERLLAWEAEGAAASNSLR